MKARLGVCFVGLSVWVGARDPIARLAPNSLRSGDGRLATLIKARGPAEVRVLHGATGTFAPGKFCAIMGPSGCGKSTLLDVVAGCWRSRGVNARLRGARMVFGDGISSGSNGVRFLNALEPTSGGVRQLHATNLGLRAPSGHPALGVRLSPSPRR